MQKQRGLMSETAEKKFTIEELKEYNGKEGEPAYIACNGKVYDVTESFLWIDGYHQGQHEAGEDLTEEIAIAPHGEEALERVKMIGVLTSGS